MSKHSATYYSCLLDLAAVPMLADRPWRVVLPRYATIIARDTIIAPYSRLLSLFLSFFHQTIVSFLLALKRKKKKISMRNDTRIRFTRNLWCYESMLRFMEYLYDKNCIFFFFFLLERNETSFNRTFIYPRVNAFKWRAREKGLSLMEVDD